MSPLWPILAIGVAALLAVAAVVRRMRAPEAEALRPNYAGIPTPVILGAGLVLPSQWATLLALALASLAAPVPGWPLPLLVIFGALLLYAVGVLDDRRLDGPRGLRGHIASLFRGHMTTGILKLAVGVGAAVVIAIEIGGGFVRVLVAAGVIALSVNVTNALDVRPGRALKWALLVLVTTTAAAWGQGVVLVLVAYVGAGLGVLPFDLRERAMLGDAGSNPLGLVVGAGLAAVLPPWGLLVGLVFLAGLQIAAETVTISRIIDAVPPLRWFDRLGRRS